MNFVIHIGWKSPGDKINQESACLNVICGDIHKMRQLAISVECSKKERVKFTGSE